LKGEELSLLTSFLADARLRGHREQGVAGLKQRVPKFLAFVEERGYELLYVGVKEAQEYQGYLLEGGRRDGGKYSTRTVASYVVAATALYAYLKREGKVFSNPFKEIKKLRVEKKLPKSILKEAELLRLLSALTQWDKEPTLKRAIRLYRLHVISELQYATGLRISEVAALRVEDIDLKRGLVVVKEGKGGASRTAYLNDYARAVLALYIERMRSLTLSARNERMSSFLFATGWGSLEHFVNRTLKEVCTRLKLPTLSSHGFRHALGYHLLRAGCPIRYIQELLGHKLLRNTEIYTKVDREDLRGVLDTHHPRRWRDGGKRAADE
jgi:integrase/recombinase XerD